MFYFTGDPRVASNSKKVFEENKEENLSSKPSIEVKQCGPSGGDCTAPYNVKLDKEYTVGEFINTILKERQGEWGNFRVKLDDVEMKCEYNRTGVIKQGISEEVLGMVVDSVQGYGGYTSMDYYIKISYNAEFSVLGEIQESELESVKEIFVPGYKPTPTGRTKPDRYPSLSGNVKGIIQKPTDVPLLNIDKGQIRPIMLHPVTNEDYYSDLLLYSWQGSADYRETSKEDYEFEMWKLILRMAKLERHEVEWIRDYNHRICRDMKEMDPEEVYIKYKDGRASDELRNLILDMSCSGKYCNKCGSKNLSTGLCSNQDCENSKDNKTTTDSFKVIESSLGTKYIIPKGFEDIAEELFKEHVLGISGDSGELQLVELCDECFAMDLNKDKCLRLSEMFKFIGESIIKE